MIILIVKNSKTGTVETLLSKFKKKEGLTYKIKY